MTLKNRILIFTAPMFLAISVGFDTHGANSNPSSSTASTTCLSKSTGDYRIAQSSTKRCEFVMETKNPANKTVKTCSYKCKGYGALANFSWAIDKPCPSSFETNFPGP